MVRTKNPTIPLQHSDPDEASSGTPEAEVMRQRLQPIPRVPPPGFDRLRFTSRVNQEWFETHRTMDFIVEVSMAWG